MQARFGPFRLDPRAATLHRGPARVRLRPKTYAVLRHLVEHAGVLVSKEELLAAVWGDVVVEEGAIKVCVQEIRDALGDDARTPRYLETHHRRGYRFVADVSHDEEGRVRRGGFTLDAAEALSPGVRALLPRLVDRSLVIASFEGEDARYRLLETVREYAGEQLERSGEADVPGRHMPGSMGRSGRRPSPHSAAVAARRGCCDSRASTRTCGRRSRTRRRRCRSRATCGGSGFTAGTGAKGSSGSERAVVLDGAARARAAVRCASGTLFWFRGDAERGRTRLEESAALARATGDRLALGNALTFLAQVQIGLGEPAAEDVAREALACFRETDRRWEVGIGAVNLGNVLRALGRHDEAARLYRESAGCFEATDDGWAIAMSLRNLATIAFRRGDHAGALALNRRALELLQPLDEKWFVSRSLEDMAGSLCALGDLEGAARLLGAGAALREDVGAEVVPFYRADYDRTVARLRSALDPVRLDAAWAQGRAATRAEAIAFALARRRRRGPGHAAGSSLEG